MSVLEKSVQRDILLAIGAEPDLLLMRNTVGTAKYYDEETGKRRVITYGLGTGTPDIVGILFDERTGLGVWFCIECKRPGETSTVKQREVRQAWETFGALVYECHSASEALEALAMARKTVERRTAFSASRSA